MKIVKATDLSEKFFENTSFKEIGIVKKILNDVKSKGDKAVKKYTKKFDKIEVKSFEISREQVKDAYRKVDKDSIKAIKKAADNIRFFAKRQFQDLKDFEVKNKGIVLGQKVVALNRVGCYVPGGLFPLPSTALMTIIPAKIAGVKEIIVCSPKIKPITIVAADIAGADKIFNVGGIQAIAAMAFGTKTIPKVDKIVGPGNKFVTAAKREVFGVVGIDMLAGPSEVLVIADDFGRPDFIAADLLAQAEHDQNAKSILITTSEKIAKQVKSQIEIQLKKLKTKKIAKMSLKNGKIIIVKNLGEAVLISDKKAPEHLELQVKNPKPLMKKLKNYGSLFIGEYSAEVFGDYCSGTNHVLPTNGTACFSGGLSVKDFVKVLTYQKINKKRVNNQIRIATVFGELEGLDAHKKAAEIRKQ